MSIPNIPNSLTCANYDLSLGQLLVSIGESTYPDYFDKCLSYGFIGESAGACTGKYRFIQATPSDPSVPVNGTDTDPVGMCVGYCKKGDKEIIVNLKDITYREYGDFNLALPVCVPGLDERSGGGGALLAPYAYVLFFIALILISFLSYNVMRSPA